MLTDTIFLIRTKAMCEQTRSLATVMTNAVGHQAVAIAVDERDAQIDTEPWKKISVSDYVGSNFPSLPADWGWRCGDMCYIAAQSVMPCVKRFWLLESDVWISPLYVADFLKDISCLSQDAVAAGLGVHPEPPRYSRKMTDFVGNNLWGCLFPFTGASLKLVKAIAELRFEIGKGYGDRDILYPNDEAVFSGVLESNRFSFADLYELLPSWFERDFFSTNPPHLLDYVNRRQPRKVVHPVVSLEKILSEVVSEGSKNYTRHRLRKVLKEANSWERSLILESLSKT